MQDNDECEKIKKIQEKMDLICTYLNENKYPIIKVKAEELISYFEGDAPSGDTTTLQQVLKTKWLLIHEIVEISELKKMDFRISFDLLISNPTEVFQAHLVATEWEFHLAKKEGANIWIRKRLKNVKSWLNDPEMTSSHISKCYDLIQKFS